MPRNVRNFWIEANVDGRVNNIACGPRSKDGGFTLSIKMRNDGSIERPLTITGHTHEDGTLWLNVLHTIDGKTDGFRIETKR